MLILENSLHVFQRETLTKNEILETEDSRSQFIQTGLKESQTAKYGRDLGDSLRTT